MVIERENDWSLTWFEALIVMDWDTTNWEGIPNITPVDSLSVKPVGSDPEVIENDNSSPSTVGVTENDWSFART